MSSFQSQMNLLLCVYLSLTENFKNWVFRLFRMRSYMILASVQLVQSKRQQDASARRVSVPRIVVARGRELRATVAAPATVTATNKCDNTWTGVYDMDLGIMASGVGFSD